VAAVRARIPGLRCRCGIPPASPQTCRSPPGHVFNSADTWATSRLGASYMPQGDLGMAAAEADIVIECTGHAQMLLEAGQYEVRNRITCLTGVSSAGTEFTVDPGATQQWTQAHQNSRARGRRRPATARPPGP